MNKTITLTNGRGEQITLTLNIEGRRTAPKNTPKCHEITITVAESSVPVELDGGVRALYEGGVSVNNWKVEGQSIICTRGDIKRLGTYPIFIYVAGDRTKNGRFILRSIEGIDRFNLNKLA